MRILLFALLWLLAQTTLAQQVVDVSKGDVRVGPNLFYTAGGEPFVNAKFVNLVDGSPYFKDQWLKGIVVDENNHEYKNIDLKLDLLDDQLHYLDDKGKEFIATTHLKEIVITDSLGDNYRFVRTSSFKNTLNGLKDGWCLWLVSGPASLYKIFNKTMHEQRPYGSATTEQRISTNQRYVVFYNNAFFEIKKLKDAPSVLANKKKELEDYLKNKDDQKASMDDRFARLIEYYNTLVKEQK